MTLELGPIECKQLGDALGAAVAQGLTQPLESMGGQQARLANLIEGLIFRIESLQGRLDLLERQIAVLAPYLAEIEPDFWLKHSSSPGPRDGRSR